MTKRKLTALFLAFLMPAFLFASCTSSDTPDDSRTAEVNAGTDEAPHETPNLLTHIFRPEEFALPDGYFVNKGVAPVYNEESGEIMCAAYSDDEVPDPDNAENTLIVRYEHVLSLSADGTVISDTVIPFEKNGTEIRNGVFTDSGMICVTYLREAGEYAVLRLSGTDYSPEKSEALDPLFTNTATIFSDKLSITGMAVDKDGSVWVCAMSELLCLDGDFIRLFSIQPDNPMGGDYFESVAIAENGKIYVSGCIGMGDVILEVDKASRSLGSPLDFDGGFDADSVRFGKGFDLYFKNTVGLYGLNLEDGSSTLLMNFNNSDVYSPGVLSVVSPEAFFSADGDSLLLYKKAEDIDLGDVVVLEVATTKKMFPPYSDAVTEFNKSGSGVRIMVSEYIVDGAAARDGISTEEHQAVMQRLVMDIATGRYKPDIIINGANNEIVDYVIKNELYTDLYPLIDKDDTVTRDNLFDCVEEAYSVDGKMWGIGPEFKADSILGTKEMLGGRESWSVTEMIDFAESLPDDVEFFDGFDQYTAKRVFFGGGGYNSFIDYENGTCSFDSPEFLRILEFFGTTPVRFDTSNRPRDYHDTVYQKYHSGKVALKDVYLTSPEDWAGLEWHFNTTDWNLIGFPTYDTGKSATCRTYSNIIITSFAEYPEKAWEFAKSIVHPDVEDLSYAELRNYISFTNGIPVLKSVLDTFYEGYYSKAYTIRYFDGSIGSRMYNPDEPVPEPDRPGMVILCTPESFEAFKTFLDTRVGGRIADEVDEEIAAIINDEISAFNAGLRDAKSTANMIQRRVSLWLAEHE